MRSARGPCLDDDLVAAFVSGTLDDAKADAVDAHLDGCEDCFALVAALAKTTSVLHEPNGADEERLPADAERVADGTRLGRYEIASLVGVGAMGVVYAATDSELRRKVALKLVRSRRGRDAAERRERLLREARTMARLAHPNVVTVHDVGTFGERVFVAMELVEGETLRRWLEKPRSQREILEAFLAAGRGLAAAHAAHVVHRDFKPDNVLVGHDGRVVVTDFGLARDPASEDAPGTIAGTPAYMSPEQLRGEEVDARSDQFSFCVALYEGLTGRRPFEGEDPAAQLAAIDAQELPPADLPAHLKAPLRRGLARAPSERFPTMSALLDALAREPTRRRRRMAIGALAIGLLLLVTVVSTSAVRRARARCRDGVPAKIAAVWTPERRAAMRDAFLATKIPYADDTWARVERGLDAEAARWSAMHVAACDATHERAEQTPELLDLRVACLDEHLVEMSSLMDVFAHADEKVVASATKAVLALGPLSRCADAASLRAVPAPAAERAEAALAIQAELARAKALQEAGHVMESLGVAQGAVERSAALGYGPLTAKAHLRLGDAQVEAREGEAASATLLRAANLADVAQDDATRAHALARRLFVEGYLLRHVDRIDELDADASAAIARAGSSTTELEGIRLHALGMGLLRRGRFEEGAAALGKAVEARERAHGAKSREVAMSRNGLCFAAGRRGDYATALDECQRATDLWIELLGPNHPDVAFGLNNLGTVLLETGHYEAASERFERVLVLLEAAFGAEHDRVAVALMNLGDALSKGGRHERALSVLERAVRLRERLPDSAEPPRELVLASLGQAYLRAGDPARALSTLERAREHESDETSADDHAQIALGLETARSRINASRRR